MCCRTAYHILQSYIYIYIAVFCATVFKSIHACFSGYHLRLTAFASTLCCYILHIYIIDDLLYEILVFSDASEIPQGLSLPGIVEPYLVS